LPTLISPACAVAPGAAAPLIGVPRAEDTFKIVMVLPMTSGQAAADKQ